MMQFIQKGVSVFRYQLQQIWKKWAKNTFGASLIEKV